MTNQDRREFLHKMIDRFMDIQDKGEKNVHFSFNGHVNNINYYLTTSDDHRAWVDDSVSWSEFSDWTEKDAMSMEGEFLERVKYLEGVRNDSVQRTITLKMSESEARGKGLIA